MRKLIECLNKNTGSYILPFFWQHGDSHELVEKEIDAIYASGCRELCVESRVHQEFCCEKWWEDFGFILREAKKRNMGVWLLDDKKFPSGFANGTLEKHPHLKKKHIELRYIDVAGPKSDAAVYLPQIDVKNEKIINVVAYKRCDEYASEAVTGEPLPLMQNVADGLVFLDIPDGVYRVFFVIETHVGKAGARMHLVDMLNPDSTHLMINEIYEPHYEHFKEYFGNTFRGFFSDEPCFGNEASTGYSRLGKENVLLPVSDELLTEISQNAHLSAMETLNLLPFLWCSHKDKNEKIRYYYMDCISRKYEKNFSRMLGDWCHEHGVMYIGHIIEDVNYHMRLGVGVGHYFRAMSGQDMAGCDIVLNQMIPGICDHIHAAPVGVRRADPEFFRYTLAKLCSSDARLDKRKKGRALCEIFGAFGWAEGVPMMKQLADNMLVSGINYFVPHAFTNRYPNPDCPPHFYCGGNYCQFDAFTSLVHYMQRMCHLFSDCEHVTNVAVLYNCEADWCGCEYELFQKISKVLLQNGIDFDYVPTDYLEDADVCDGFFEINGCKFSSLVVSYSSALPHGLMQILKNLANRGVTVVFCEKYPDKCFDADVMPHSDSFVCTPNDAVPEVLDRFRDIRLSENCRYLRYNHVKSEGRNVYMFSNEDAFHGIDVEVKLSHGGEYVRYDAFDNSMLYGVAQADTVKLSLAPSQSVVYIFEDHGKIVDDVQKEYTYTQITPAFTIETFEDGKPVFFDKTDKLYNLAPKLPRYAGKIRYTAELDFDAVPQRLVLSQVGEIAYVTLNGRSCGLAILPPYEFDISRAAVPGKNKLEIEVVSNPGYRDRDNFSSYLSLPLMGITGKIEVKSTK